jgi:Phosphoglucomutase/phosphomannomutase, alpha/beta/alpha domain I
VAGRRRGQQALRGELYTESDRHGDLQEWGAGASDVSVTLVVMYLHALVYDDALTSCTQSPTLLLLHFVHIYSIIVAGDGRYFNAEAIPIICKVLAGNNVVNIWVPSGGIMSTPAVSAVIRTREGGKCEGGIILTASHNPGGPGEDFGIKYNLQYGQPAGEDFTDEVSIAVVMMMMIVLWKLVCACMLLLTVSSY